MSLDHDPGSPAFARPIRLLASLATLWALAWPAAAGAQTPVAIHEVQGSGASVARTDFVEVEGIVIGDFQGAEQLAGFFLQEEDADADGDPATSEGVFVDCGACPVDVAVGDRVRAMGNPTEVDGMSVLPATGSGAVVISASEQPLPTATSTILGEIFDDELAYEALEGMLVRVEPLMVVAETFELDRYGQLVLTKGRYFQYTQRNPPDSVGYAAHLDDLARNSIILDDDDNVQNAALFNSDAVAYHPLPGFSTTNFVRIGDSIDDLQGVLHWSESGQTGTDAWRLRPVPEAFAYDFAASNPRPLIGPAPGGSLRIATFNLLNYFDTLDTGTNVCGPFQ